MKNFVFLASLYSLTIAAPACATQFGFRYVTNSGHLEGIIDGALQNDNNTIKIVSLSNVSFENILGPKLTYFNTLSGYFNSNIETPIVTVDGSTMDFVACDALPTCEGFYIQAPMSFSGPPFIASAISYGNLFELYEPKNWSINVIGAVPEPQSWAMLITGFGLTGFAMRRRSSAAII